MHSRYNKAELRFLKISSLSWSKILEELIIWCSYERIRSTFKECGWCHCISGGIGFNNAYILKCDVERKFRRWWVGVRFSVLVEASIIQSWGPANKERVHLRHDLKAQRPPLSTLSREECEYYCNEKLLPVTRCLYARCHGPLPEQLDLIVSTVNIC